MLIIMKSTLNYINIAIKDPQKKVDNIIKELEVEEKEMYYKLN
jgi:hypothetical protein